MTDKESEKAAPIEVKIIEKPIKQEEEPEEIQYYDDLEITKEDIEEFEKDEK